MALLSFCLALFTLTLILGLTAIFGNNDVLKKTVKYLGIIILVFILGGLTYRLMTDKMTLDKSDYYGEYVVDRDYFRGKQAYWQYDHFRFEIKENDSLYFHVTDKAKILATHRGKISTTTQYESQHLILEMVEPYHHILSSNPTTYRSAWSFRLVFHSPKFNNLYFKKGKWEPLED